MLQILSVFLLTQCKKTPWKLLKTNRWLHKFMGTFCRTEESLIICLPLLVLDVTTQHSSSAAGRLSALSAATVESVQWPCYVRGIYWLHWTWKILKSVNRIIYSRSPLWLWSNFSFLVHSPRHTCATLSLPLFSPFTLLQTEAVGFPLVSEAARWLVCDARWRGGGCQVSAQLFMFICCFVF